MEVLSSTRWDAELALVKAERAKLYPLLGLTPPVAASADASKKGAAANKKVEDEHSSYASLVDTMGY
eukprot:643052-Prorocentrum_minimum.AAC.1